MIISKKLQNRYNTLKLQEPDCLLLMQVGVFMQVMNDDARAVSAVTGLKLQMAGDIDDPVVLGGFPHSDLNAYIGRLARAGHSVAIALQHKIGDRPRFRDKRKLGLSPILRLAMNICLSSERVLTSQCILKK